MKTKPIKQNRALRHGLISAVAGMAFMSLVNPVRAEDLVVNTFDFGIGGIAWQNWRSYVTGHDQVWDPLVDADGNPASGSMYVTVNWPLQSDANWNNGWNDVQIAYSVPVFSSSDYIELEASIKIDLTNSFTALDGGYGVAGLYVNGGSGGWQQVQGYVNLSATTNWQRIHGFMSVVPGATYDQVVLGLISNGGSSLTNTVAYWMDNIRITAPPTVNTNPPPLTIAKAPPAGLTCIASMPGDAWQRQMVRTVNSDFSWDTATARSNTTTYSINIADFPDAAYAGFEAMMYLIPVAGMPGSGPDGVSVDWDSSHVVYFTISANGDGTAKGNFRYKVNDPGAEHFRSWTDLPCAAGPLGTWSLAVNNNTNVTVTAPSGSNTTVTIPQADAANFQGPLIAYFGVRPADSARIGQSATFGRIQITGAAASIDDSFTSQGSPYVLNPNTWVRKASSPQGLFITAPDAKYWISWPTPDSGFTNLYATEDLARKLGNNQWVGLPTAATGWIEAGGNKRVAIINQSALNAAFGHPPAYCFFGLWQVTP
ncbi:MAG TPA: hypothetical protein VNT26_11155 [Candidatus Sulfotelmatobacter sp.]|nr:hypothetical protein [Candidatus Sulfotelmatobacter sp.]